MITDELLLNIYKYKFELAQTLHLHQNFDNLKLSLPSTRGAVFQNLF